MYEKFYGFKENPFTITPDPKFFFPSPKHTEVLDSLIYTVTERRGFAVITGEIGSGKTTICRTLLSRLNPGTKVTMITNTYLSPKELLSYTLEELGVTFNGREKSNLLSCLRKFLVEQLYLDFNVVLIIDEAQNLSLNVLEEIRMLSNLETEKKKMIQIILTGQPALKDKLASKELEQLRQRINVQYHIPPLNRINSERYINHRLEVASINGNRKVEFTPEAIDKIYAHSQGIPRVINMVCNNALLIGYVTEAAQITPEIIKEAIEIQFNQENPELKTTETQLKQKNSELKETETQLKQLNEQLNSNQEKLATRQSQLQEAGTKLTQLNEQLNQLKKNKEEVQLQQAKLEQLWLERQKQWQAKEEEASKQLQSTQAALNNSKSLLDEKTLELKELTKRIELSKGKLWYLEESRLKDLTYTLQIKQNLWEKLKRNLIQLKEGLKNLQQKIKCQQGQEKLNQVWIDHQLQWQQKEKEILEQFKFIPLNKATENKNPSQIELKHIVNPSDNLERKPHSLEKSARSLAEKPVIKLKAKHPKAEATVLTAYTFNGEIKIDPIGNDDSLSSFYNGIRIFHRNADIGNYKNFIFFAKGERERDYLTVFRIELSNGAGKVGKYCSVGINDSWQKFNIPLEDFSRMINLNIITETTIFLDAITGTDDITYIKDICFSNG
jgi:general secretion pathway protein A